jgi:micrococcal nuclease
MKANKLKLCRAATTLLTFRYWIFDPGCIACFILLSLLVRADLVCAQTWFTVKWVNDGDTIVLTNGKRVRYIGINSPEIDHDKQRAQPFGYAARALNQQMVLNQKIRLEYDRERQDRYGRLLAYIFLPNGIFLNEHLLQRGYAYLLYRKPNLKYHQRLLKAQREAMKAGNGLWKNWSESKKQYIGNRNSRRFHAPDCPNARKINWRNRTVFSSKWDAFKEGYAPAGGCIKEFWK